MKPSGDESPARPNEEAVRRRLEALERSLPKLGRKRWLPPEPLDKAPKGRKLKKQLLVAALASILALIALPPFYWPLRAPVSSGFLLRLKPDSKRLGLEIHHGIDLAAARGRPVRATALGVVSAVGEGPELGKFVVLQHLFGFKSLYAHLDRAALKRGQIVAPGLSVIGEVGDTGRSTGPHLHFGIYFMDLPCPPSLLLVFHSLRRALFGRLAS